MCSTITSYLFVFLFTLSNFVLPSVSSSGIESFVFSGCSEVKYDPGSSYQDNLNSLLTSLVNAATYNTYNNNSFPQTPTHDHIDETSVYGLFQCRSDLSNNNCGHCVARAVSQLGTICVGKCGGAIQLQGCFVRYDNKSFFGVEDKTLVLNRCGPSIGYSDYELTQLEAMLQSLRRASSDGLYGTKKRSGVVYGVSQCVGDLSQSDCEDCLSDAIGRLKSDCWSTAWGDVYLAKCYARFSMTSDLFQAPKDDTNKDTNKNDAGVQKTLAILIAAIAVVALILICISYWSRKSEEHKCCI